jgi:hypothetical protein
MFEKIGQINRGSLLGEQIYRLTKLSEVKTIIEIGTWNGLGSTKCIYDGIIESGKKDFFVLSIECNLARHNEAKQNLLPLNNFHLAHGTIIKLEEISPLMEREREQIFKNNWLDEESIHLKNCPFILNEIPEKIDLLILDGGEFSSSLEFNKLHQKAHFIVLDDTRDKIEWIPKGHILKNSEVRKYILKNPDKFKVIVDNQKDRNGFFICERK